MMNSFGRGFLLALKRLRHGDRFLTNGVEVFVPASVDAEIRYLLLRGRRYEQAEAIFVRRMLRSGMNVLELGGSIGVISAVVRSVIGPEAHHLIVEADAALAEICLVNACQGALLGRTNVVCGAIDYTGASNVVFDPGHNAHTGHVDPNGRSGDAVPTLTASTAAKNLPQGPFALVCDIEGAEFQMIMKDTALLLRVSLIIMELHPPRYAAFGGTTENLFAKLAEHGFTLVEKIDEVVLMTRVA